MPRLAIRLVASLAVALFASVPRSGVAQVAENPRVAEAVAAVQTWLEAERAYEQIPGVSAAIVHDQELVWSGAYGMAHPDRQMAATPTTVYSICSISKLFTSISVMQLRDRGLVDLTAPVSTYLPWFTLHQQFDGSAPITVEGLLTHSAGLPRESDQPYWSAPDFPFPTREEIIEGLQNQETLYPAWKYFQYSNLGLTLVGEIVRQVSGMPYDQYVREHVLTPLDLTNTYPEIPAELRGGQLADGFSALTREGTREPTPFFQAKGIAPAAGFASTAEDLAKFASWQFRLTPGHDEVLNATTLDEMQRVHYVDPGWETFWGLGFSVQRHDDRTFVGHGGSCPGFRTELSMQKDDKIAVVFMANAMVNTSTYISGMYDLVADAIRGAAKGGGEASAAADTVTVPDLEPYLGTYSQQPWGGETAALRWKGGLAFMTLPTGNPSEAITRLRWVEEDLFRRIRDDDELGEDIVFERDASGRVTGYRRFGNLSPRVR
ncbi:MAG: serine hydrolase domain-containing protein [Gemmatimonadota bacterium]|jgi:CubicO group peptidase (beta-lactamase class C family)